MTPSPNTDSTVRGIAPAINRIDWCAAKCGRQPERTSRKVGWEMGGADGPRVRSLPVDVEASTGGSERETLRAVLAFHRKIRAAQHRTPVPRERTLEDLNRLFERQPRGRSPRDRIVDIGVREGANVYVTDHSTVDQLRVAIDKGLPVIVGTQSTEGSSFAVVVAIDDSAVYVISPRGGGVKPIPALAFGQLWHCLDEGVDHEHWCAILNFDNRELAGVFRQGRDVTPPDRRRKNYILTAAWSIFFAELALSYLAYRNPHRHLPPIVALALAMLGFTLIDFFARPEKREYTGALVPRWYRPFLPFWCLVPFITAVGGSVWVHYEKWSDARTDVRQLAREIKAAVEWPDDNKLDAGSSAAKAKLEAIAVAAPARPSFDNDDDDPVADAVTDRGSYAADEATDRCWHVAHERNVVETKRVRSDAATLDGTTNPFAVFAALRLPVGDRKDIARQLATNRTWRCFTTERVTAKVAVIVRTRYLGDPSSDEAKRFTEIARVIGHDVLLNRGDINEVCNGIRDDTGSGLVLAVAIQALFIFWIPALLAVSISRALKRTRRVHTRWDVQRSIDLRDYKIIAEDEYLFLPRLCFAILLVLGTNYVFAPLGLKASYIMSIVDEHALPGHTTFTLWSTAFSQAPVIVVGFVGFLIYALITATQRFALDDFDDRALLALLVRGLVVMLLSFALSSSDINEFASRTFVFIAGVFPVRALEAIAKRVNVSIDPDFSGPQDSSFAGLPGLDPVKVFAMRAAGIQSTYDLAAMNIQDVAERVRIDPRLLGRAVDRAILIDTLGLTLTNQLSDYGVTSATELVDTPDLNVLIMPAADEAGRLMRAANTAQARLRTDERVRSVRGWLAARRDDE